jgi:hypothetical protein
VSIPAQRPPPPALPVAIAILGAGTAVPILAHTYLRVNVHGWGGEGYRLSMLLSMATTALAIAATWVAAIAALSHARARRSPGTALTSAAFVLGALALCVQLVVIWMWPWGGTASGWRHDTFAVIDWVLCAVPVLATAGLCASGWTDRAVRLIAPAAIGAALLAEPPPPLLTWAFQTVEFGAYKWDTTIGDYRLVPDGRLWIVPSLLALGRLAWAGATAWLVARQAPIPVDTVTPHPPAPALRRFAVSLIAMAVVALAAGIVLAFTPKSATFGSTLMLDIVIPILVAIAAAVVGATLVNIAVTDVAPVPSRRAAVAAICVLWCVAVLVAVILSRPRFSPGEGLNPLLSAMVENRTPTMPSMVGAGVAALALLNIVQAVSACAQQAGLRPSRGQNVIVILALAIGALTTPWVLGFGERGVQLDSLRIATLVSAAMVNLAAWIALARSAWRAAAAFDDAVIASAP